MACTKTWTLESGRWTMDGRRWTMNINYVSVTQYGPTMWSRKICEKGVFICLPHGQKSESILKRKSEEKSLPQVTLAVSHYLRGRCLRRRVWEVKWERGGGLRLRCESCNE